MDLGQTVDLRDLHRVRVLGEHLRGPEPHCLPPGPALGRQPDSGVLVLDTKGIDPAVQMGTLEALLTGEQYDVVASRPRAGHLIAGDGQEGP